MAQTTVEDVLKLQAELETKRQEAIQELLNQRKEIESKLKALGFDGVPEWVKPSKRASTTRAGGKRVYKIDPAKKVEAVYKRTLTRLTNGGMKTAEAKKRAQAAADGLKKKLGVK